VSSQACQFARCPVAVSRCSHVVDASGKRPWLLVLCAMAVLFVPCVGASAQDEDADEVAVVQVRPAVTDEQFDQWVFQQHRNAAGARKSMNSQLVLQTEHIDRACALTDVQKNKLQLAGRGDIKRFFDRYEEIKWKFKLIQHDQQKANQIWQDINPLQMTLRSGLFHADSFFYKTVRNTLSDDQFTSYTTVDHKRRKLHHRAQVELTVAVLEQGIPLRDEQRQKLIELLLSETKPPRKSGQHDYYVIMYRISRMPKERIRPLFDDIQWKVLTQQLAQAKGMEHWLKKSGYLLDDDEDGD